MPRKTTTNPFDILNTERPNVFRGGRHRWSLINDHIRKSDWGLAIVNNWEHVIRDKVYPSMDRAYAVLDNPNASETQLQQANNNIKNLYVPEFPRMEDFKKPHVVDVKKLRADGLWYDKIGERTEYYTEEDKIVANVLNYGHITNYQKNLLIEVDDLKRGFITRLDGLQKQRQEAQLKAQQEAERKKIAELEQKVKELENKLNNIK